MSASSSAVAHFPNDVSSSGDARRFVSATLDEWDFDDLDEVACLLVSELVSNALLHAGTDLDVNLHRSGSRVRVEVHDRSHRLPERKFYSTTSVTGRGLVFVSELAQDWGFEPTAEGKAVWFELDASAAPPVPAMAGADLLDGWEDWDDLEPASPADPVRPTRDPSPGGTRASTPGERRLVGVP